jgi:hypothetical protein
MHREGPHVTMQRHQMKTPPKGGVLSGARSNRIKAAFYILPRALYSGSFSGKSILIVASFFALDI